VAKIFLMILLKRDLEIWQKCIVTLQKHKKFLIGKQKFQLRRVSGMG
jgi:hypothetical protein